MQKNDQNADLVSVVVPIYGVEKYLSTCVNSILNQTYSNLQIILVDDGSKDSCPQICDSFAEKDSRVTVIHKPNGGLSDARNSGLSNCLGEYVLFIDSDDMIHPDMVNRLHSLCRNYQAQIAVCDFLNVPSERFQIDELINKHQEKQEIETFDPEQALIAMMDVYKGFQVSACNKLFQRSLLDGFQFPIGKLYEDIGSTYKLIARSKQIVYTHEPLYFYRVRKQSITHSGFSLRDYDKVEYATALSAYIHENFPNAYPQALVYQYVYCYMTIINKIINTPESHAKEYLKELLHEIRVHISDIHLDNVPTKKKIGFWLMLYLFPLYECLLKLYLWLK